MINERTRHALYENRVPQGVRMLVLGSAEPHFYASSPDQQQVLKAALCDVFAVWQEWGAKYMGSVDDDLLMAGMPRARKHHFFVIYEVDGLEMASAMMNLFRKEFRGVVPNCYFRFESMLGRGFFPADEAAMSTSSSIGQPTHQ